MRPLKDGCCPNGEVQLASIAAVEAALASRDAILTGASRAGNSIRPKAGFKVKPCCLLVGEHLEELEGADCALAHELIVDNSREGVKYYFVRFCIYFQSLRVRLVQPTSSKGNTMSVTNRSTLELHS